VPVTRCSGPGSPAEVVVEARFAGPVGALLELFAWQDVSASP